VDQKAKTLIIEHPVRPEFRLLTTKPAETTRSAWRFEVKLAAGATEKFPVSEERVYETSTALANLTPDVLLSYIRNKNLSDAARAQLERIADLKRNVAAAEREIRETEEQIASMVRDQDRIRQNVNSLNQVSGQQQQVQAYARQLATQEAQLAAMRDRVAETQRRRTSLQSEIDIVIEKLQF
jgi:chromosome segregation ATPase